MEERVTLRMVSDGKYSLSDVGRRIGYTLEKAGKALLRSSLAFPEPTKTLREYLLALVASGFSNEDPVKIASDVADGTLTGIDVPDEAYVFFPRLEDQIPEVADLVSRGWLKEALEDWRAVSTHTADEQHRAAFLMKMSREMYRKAGGTDW
jgi:hypothetical protein